VDEQAPLTMECGDVRGFDDKMAAMLFVVARRWLRSTRRRFRDAD
jgi:hypothetical protein